MPAHEVDELYEIIQEECLPGLWSKGVALARAGAVIKESVSTDEIAVRVQVKDRPTSPKVQLWPGDEDWFCDCGEKTAVCAHAAAAVIAAKQGQITERSELSGTPSLAPFVRYRFTREQGSLAFDRFIVRGGQEEILQGSLIGLVGGIKSGRVASATIVTSKEDFAVDAVLAGKKRGIFERPLLAQVLGALKDCSNIQLDDREIRVSSVMVAPQITVFDEGDEFKLEVTGDESVTEIFKNGAALCGDTIKPVAEIAIAQRQISKREIARFVSETLPELQKKCSVVIKTERLPKLDYDARPRAVLNLEDLSDGSLAVTPRIVYGDPAIAELVGDELRLLRNTAPFRRRENEREVVRRLQNELHLSPARTAKFHGQGAIQFRASLKGWDVEGRGAERFEAKTLLTPRLVLGHGGFDLSFEGGGNASATAEAALQAWQEGSRFVPLVGGGFGQLPSDWLERHGDVLASLLDTRKESGQLPAYLLPTLAEAAEELGAKVPDPLIKLRENLTNGNKLKPTILPQDLRADLREYQSAGINWLTLLRDNGMGALLADDMGLGKTLQALCAIEGRTLIVSPTSVLHSWAEQIERFRPQLKYSIYHGGGRQIDSASDVTLTTYSILRLDRQVLTAKEWDTVVIDEAQTIKNPDSQVAKAAHALKGKFRIALTGTPVENRLDDLWSQFQFLAPGLLGSRTRFQETLSRDTLRLRRRIKPFVLRRLKRDVAPELPSRTELVLQCELSQNERALYQSVFAATQKELVAKVQSGASVMQLLEALMRLRQASCHPGLLPGQRAPSSSKLDLLLENLEEAVSEGHRALIFSQWTSLLDLVEPRLKERRITFSRLDGSTPNRQAVVADFQRPDGPSTMLLSLKAGGVGLTLTAADHIFLLDPWWNPAVEDQAADRAHRIGQTNPVFVHRLIAKDTVEERILQLQKRKKDLAAAVLEGTAETAGLTKEDLLDLLS